MGAFYSISNTPCRQRREKKQIAAVLFERHGRYGSRGMLRPQSASSRRDSLSHAYRIGSRGTRFCPPSLHQTTGRRSTRDTGAFLQLTRSPADSRRYRHALLRQHVAEGSPRHASPGHDQRKQQRQAGSHRQPRAGLILPMSILQCRSGVSLRRCWPGCARLDGSESAPVRMASPPSPGAAWP